MNNEEKGSFSLNGNQEESAFSKKIFIPLFLLVLSFGIISGWLLTKLVNHKEFKKSSLESCKNGEELIVGKVYGSVTQNFKDKAVGILEKNENGGEGTHRLIREGGESQTVYLTSSVLDLDMFVGRNVEIKGETYASQRVGWLMDVGSVQILK